MWVELHENWDNMEFQRWIPRDNMTVEQEIEDLLYAVPENVNFMFHPHSNMVDVYYNESFLYRIDKEMYHKLVDGMDDSEHARALNDCVE